MTAPAAPTPAAPAHHRPPHGQHFVVTGAGTGIGRAIAQRLGRDGAHLTLLARDLSRLERTAQQLRESGVPVHVASVDIRSRAALDTHLDDAVRTLGPIHGVIANSGVGGANHDGPGDRWSEIVSTNLDGTYATLRSVEARLHPGPGPRHMVVLSSILGRFGVPGYTAYCASKAGLLGLVRAYALELAPKNVQVNALCPGWVSTDMAWSGVDAIAKDTGLSREEAFREAMKPVPLGRMSEPEDVAGVVAWLVGPDARGVTGQGIDVNNGAWMG